MKYPLRFGIVVLLVCGTSLFGQSNASPAQQKKQIDPTASNSNARAATAWGNQGTASGGLEVLSDTMGVDFGPYLARVVHDVKANWYNLIPESASAPIMKKGNVAIEFAILRDGGVAGMKLAYSSGDLALDRAAWTGIILSNPFPPLPLEFGGQYLALRMKFVYNPDRSDVTAQGTNSGKPTPVVVSPDSVQLASGAKQQFSAGVPGIANSAVIWNLSCAVAFCGRISRDGLYIAPLSVPNLTTVTVIATLAADPIKTGSAMVTVQPSRSK